MAYQPQPGYQPAPGYYPGPPGYAPPPQPYAPAPQPYAPAPQPYAPASHSSHSSNVVVVTQPSQPQVMHTTYVERDSPNHCLHCIITFFCPWWIFIWIIVCCIYGC